MKNKSSIIDRNRKAIAGIEQEYANVPSIVLDGVSRSPAGVVKILQDQIDAADATAKASVAFHQTVAVEKTARATGNAVFLALKTRVFSDFKNVPATLGVFGLVAPSRRKPGPETLTNAAVKRKATRLARHTVGPKKRKEITGVVPVAPAVTPVSHP